MAKTQHNYSALSFSIIISILFHVSAFVYMQGNLCSNSIKSIQCLATDHKVYSCLAQWMSGLQGKSVFSHQCLPDRYYGKGGILFSFTVTSSHNLRFIMIRDKLRLMSFSFQGYFVRRKVMFFLSCMSLFLFHFTLYKVSSLCM